MLINGWWSISSLTLSAGAAIALFPNDHIVSPTNRVRSSVLSVNGTGELGFDGISGNTGVLGRNGQGATVFGGILAVDGNTTLAVESPYQVNRLRSDRDDDTSILSVVSTLTVSDVSSYFSGRIVVQADGVLSVDGGNLTISRCVDVYGQVAATNTLILCSNTSNFFVENVTTAVITLTSSSVNVPNFVIEPNANLNIRGASLIVGNLQLDGLLFVDASDSNLLVQGHYIQTATGGLAVTTLDPTTTPLAITRNATLNGYLSFSLKDDPTEDTTYKVATVEGSIIGKFATVEPAGGKVYEPSLEAVYEANAITLTYVNSSDSKSPDNTLTYIIVGCVVGGALLLGVIAVVVIVVIRKRREGYTAVK